MNAFSTLTDTARGERFRLIFAGSGGQGLITASITLAEAAIYFEGWNAVQTQVWIAICVYVLVAIIRKELKLDLSLHRILQVLSVTPFEKVPLAQLLTNETTIQTKLDSHNQLSFNDF